MRRLAWFLILGLLLSGCARAERVEAPEPAESAPQELPAAEAENPPTEETPPQTAEKTELTLDGLNSYVRLTLPESWQVSEQAQKERAAGASGFRFSPEGEQDLVCTLAFWPDGFRLGVDDGASERLELPGGGSARRYSEIRVREDGTAEERITLWLEGLPDDFTLTATASPLLLERYAEDLNFILSGLRTGQLAYPQPVKPSLAVG